MIHGKGGIVTPASLERQVAWPAPPVEDGLIALIRAVITIVRRKLLPLSIWVLGCLLIAYLFAQSRPPVYTATATLILEAPTQSRGAPGEAIIERPLDLNRVDSQLQVIRSERLQRIVFENLALANHPELQPPVEAAPTAETPAALDPLPAPAEEEAWPDSPDADRAREEAFARFRQRFRAQRIGQSYVLEISYSSAHPELAQRIANAGASAYLLQSVSFKAAAASGGAEFVQSRLDMLEREVTAAATAVRQGRLPEILISNAEARIIGAALAPLTPSAPRVKLIAALGGVLGLLSGLFFIAIRSAMDRRIGEGQKLRAQCGLQLLAAIPRTKHLDNVDRDRRFATAARDLRTAIDLSFGSEVKSRSRSIAFLSCDEGTGCSTLVLTLAHMMQRSGRRAVIVDADIQGGPRGLTLLHRDAPSRRESGGPTLLDIGSCRLLPSTALHHLSERFADLRDPSVGDVLLQAQSNGDLLIDLPPLSESADARALARYADAVILVVTSEITLDQIAEARHQMEQSGVVLLGVVINDPGRRGFMARFRQKRARTTGARGAWVKAGARA